MVSGISQASGSRDGVTNMTGINTQITNIILYYGQVSIHNDFGVVYTNPPYDLAIHKSIMSGWLMSGGLIQTGIVGNYNHTITYLLEFAIVTGADQAIMLRDVLPV